VTAFTPIDLSQLPAPDVVEALDYEQIRAALLADLVARWPDFDAAALESDPAVKLLEVAAYRELVLRARVNDAAKAVLLAHATGADLDNLAALLGVVRLVVQQADDTTNPKTPEILETDARFRARIQLALEGFSTAGPTGAYVFWGLSASALVKDIDATSPTPGVVVVTVLSTQADGTPDQALLDTVNAQLNAEETRPLTDQVTVQGPSTLHSYNVTAELTLYPGPSAEAVRQAAEDAVAALVTQHHALGHDIKQAALYAALHQPGVQAVNLTEPAADLNVAFDEAAHCAAITVTVGGTDE